MAVRIVDDDSDDPAPGSTHIVWGERPSDPGQRKTWAESIARVCFAGIYAVCGDAPEGSPEWQAAESQMRDDLTFALHTLMKNIEACQLTKKAHPPKKSGAERRRSARQEDCCGA